MSFSGEPAGSLSASGGNQTGTRTAADGSPSSMAAENGQQPCMMPVPSADGCRHLTSAESMSMTYNNYLSETSNDNLLLTKFTHIKRENCAYLCA